MTKKAGRKDSGTPDFETALKELEAIVADLERGEATLEDSLQRFERGIALTRTCQAALEQAEQKVAILIEEHGKAAPEPYGNDTEG